MEYSEKLKKFPVFSYLDSTCELLKKSESRAVVLTAETGAGKSTVFPVGLLKNFSGKILMTEPRRIAACGVAERISSLLDQPCGKTCGYKIHLENKISSETRLEVVTEAVLVRMLQADPVLEGYDVVVLDEFHERSVNLDLALAFLKEAMELRENLFAVVMSATIDSEKIASYFGGCEKISVPGRLFPVEIQYKPGVDVCQAVKTVIDSGRIDSGSVLVFLPGIKEIRNCAENLKYEFSGKNYGNIEIAVLHSSVSLEEQKSVLRPAEENKIRIVVSSAIAETSLTIPDVKIVIDSGLCRMNKINVHTGMNSLVTSTESVFSARQRAGRSGRLQNGLCIRLWSQSEQLINEYPPEILRTDLSELVLQCSDRGVCSPEKINWLDSPSFALWSSAQKLLENLELICDGGKITEKGKFASGLGISPRLASVAVSAFFEKFRKSEGGSGNPSVSGNDKNQKSSPEFNSGISEKVFALILKYSQYAQSSSAVQKKFTEQLKNRLREMSGNTAESAGCSCKPEELLPFILYGFPDRVARRISEYGKEIAEYQFVSGRKAVLHSSIKNAPEWLCSPEVNLSGPSAVIFSFEELKGPAFENWLKDHEISRTECWIENGRICKSKNLCLGEIVLSSVKIPAESEDFSNAWCSEVSKKGLEILPLDAKIRNLLLRTEFYILHKDVNENFSKAENNDEDFLELSGYENLSEKLCKNAELWLKPFLSGVTKLTPEIVFNGLYWILNGALIDRKVPVEMFLENGRKVRIQYEKTGGEEKIKPFIEVIIQKIFGCFKTPSVCGKPVTLKLLSPASRPLQITQDLENFWQNTWPEICREMKGRYPKHNWDYRVAEKD